MTLLFDEVFVLNQPEDLQMLIMSEIGVGHPKCNEVMIELLRGFHPFYLIEVERGNDFEILIFNHKKMLITILFYAYCKHFEFLLLYRRQIIVVIVDQHEQEVEDGFFH